MLVNFFKQAMCLKEKDLMKHEKNGNRSVVMKMCIANYAKETLEALEIEMCNHKVTVIYI